MHCSYSFWTHKKLVPACAPHAHGALEQVSLVQVVCDDDEIVDELAVGEPGLPDSQRLLLEEQVFLSTSATGDDACVRSLAPHGEPSGFRRGHDRVLAIMKVLQRSVSIEPGRQTVREQSSSPEASAARE